MADRRDTAGHLRGNQAAASTPEGGGRLHVDRPQLLAVAAAIADGSAVDWAAIETSEPAITRELRVIASVAALHRHMQRGADEHGNEHTGGRGHDD